MDARVIPIESWVDCLRQSSEEIASNHLRFDADPRAKALPASTEGKCPGAYIAIHGDGTSIHLGITSSPEGCRAIARGLLGAHRSTELSDPEVVDGLSEVLNIVAGTVKSKMISQDPTLQLGLPMFMVGEIQTPEGTEKASTVARLGPVECELMVFRRPRAA